MLAVQMLMQCAGVDVGLLHGIAGEYLLPADISRVICVGRSMDTLLLRRRRVFLLYSQEKKWRTELMNHRHKAMYHASMARLCEGMMEQYIWMRLDLEYTDWQNGRIPDHGIGTQRLPPWIDDWMNDIEP